MNAPIFLLTILLTALHHINAADGDADDHPCSKALSDYPKNETDPDGNIYLMQITSASCTCTTDDSQVLCEYSIEGNSDKGSTKYDSVSCGAVMCDEEVTEEGGFLKVCSEPDNWKGAEGFDVTIFDAAVFEPWCVDPATLEEGNGSHRLGGYYQLLLGVSVGLVAAII